MNPAPAPTPTPPPPATAGGVGLVQEGGSLSSCSHLTDGTYAVVVGDWDEADLLAKVSGDGYVYTVTKWTAPTWPYVALDTANPQAYVDAVKAYHSQHG